MNSSGVREMTAHEHHAMQELRARTQAEEEPRIVKIARAIHDGYEGIKHLRASRTKLDLEIAEREQRLEVLHKDMQSLIAASRREESTREPPGPAPSLSIEIDKW